MKILAAIVAPFVVLLALLLGVTVLLDKGPPTGFESSRERCLPSLPDSVDEVDLAGDQWQSARAIVDVGRSIDVPARGWVIAVATALQESTLRPLGYGDRDSLGLFQQRAAWAPATARLDPVASARMFYTGGRSGQPGLLDVEGWTAMPLAQAAQAVQVSAFPDAYARWESLSQTIVEKVAGVTVSCAASTAWIAPVRAGSFVFTAAFGECGSNWSFCHTGLDFAASTGTPAMTAADGTVAFSGAGGPYGNLVRVLHPGGVSTWYAHLDTRLVTIGARVRAGDVVGLVGATGNTTGPHLHFEVRTSASGTDSGRPVDPRAWLAQRQALP